VRPKSVHGPWELVLSASSTSVGHEISLEINTRCIHIRDTRVLINFTWVRGCVVIGGEPKISNPKP
jgi:hypothetical protein